MKLDATLEGKLDAALARELVRGEAAVMRAVRRAGQGLKEELRGQVRGAGLGGRLANTWRAKTYPERGASLGAAALVWSKAPQVVRAFDEGVTIRSKNGFWLAIPTENAPKRGVGGGRISPSNFPEHRFGRLRFVYRPGKPGLLVAEGLRASFSRKTGEMRGFRRAGERARAAGRTASVVMFVLVPQVRLRKRLDAGTAGHRWLQRLESMIAAEWDGEQR